MQQHGLVQHVAGRARRGREGRRALRAWTAHGGCGCASSGPWCGRGVDSSGGNCASGGSACIGGGCGREGGARQQEW